jgi:hypothetical protein
MKKTEAKKSRATVPLNEKRLPPPLSRMDRMRLRKQAVRRAGRRPDLPNRWAPSPPSAATPRKIEQGYSHNIWPSLDLLCVWINCADINYFTNHKVFYPLPSAILGSLTQLEELISQRSNFEIARILTSHLLEPRFWTNILFLPVQNCGKISWWLAEMFLETSLN